MGQGYVSLGVAVVGAAGTVISAWLVARVREVQKAVNGHTEKLEARIDSLQAELSSLGAAQSSGAPLSSGPDS